MTRSGARSTMQSISLRWVISHSGKSRLRISCLALSAWSKTRPSCPRPPTIAILISRPRWSNLPPEFAHYVRPGIGIVAQDRHALGPRLHFIRFAQIAVGRADEIGNVGVVLIELKSLAAGVDRVAIIAHLEVTRGEHLPRQSEVGKRLGDRLEDRQ